MRKKCESFQATNQWPGFSNYYYKKSKDGSLLILKIFFKFPSIVLLCYLNSKDSENIKSITDEEREFTENQLSIFSYIYDYHLKLIQQTLCSPQKSTNLDIELMLINLMSFYEKVRILIFSYVKF